MILSPLDANLTNGTQLSSGELNSAIKDLHYLVDQVVRAKSMLGQNMKVISAIAVKIGTMKLCLAEETLTEDMEAILREHDVLLDSANCLLERAMNVSNHVGTQSLIIRTLFIDNATSFATLSIYATPLSVLVTAEILWRLRDQRITAAKPSCKCRRSRHRTHHEQRL